MYRWFLPRLVAWVLGFSRVTVLVFDDWAYWCGYLPKGDVRGCNKGFGVDSRRFWRGMRDRQDSGSAR